MAQKLAIFLLGALIGIAILQPSRSASTGLAAASAGALEPSAQHPEHVQDMMPPMDMLKKNTRSKRYAYEDGRREENATTAKPAFAPALHENTINYFIRFILVLLTVTPTFM